MSVYLALHSNEVLSVTTELVNLDLNWDRIYFPIHLPLPGTVALPQTGLQKHGAGEAQDWKQLFMYMNNWDEGLAPAICPQIIGTTKYLIYAGAAPPDLYLLLYFSSSKSGSTSMWLHKYAAPQVCGAAPPYLYLLLF